MRYVISAEKRAGGTGPVGDVDTTFDRERYAVKRAERLVPEDGGFRGSGLRLSAVRIQMNDGIQLGLKGCYLAKVGLDKFYWRNSLKANTRSCFGDGGKRRKGRHKGTARLFVHEMLVKREAMCGKSVRPGRR